MSSIRSHEGHAHFWERAALTRRKFLSSAALAGGAALTSPLWAAKLAEAAPFAEADPSHIPGGTTLPFQPTPFHFYFPGAGDIATITDFEGVVGVADIPFTGSTHVGALQWKADVRFMKGTYVGTEGDTRTGAFAFI